MECSWKIIFKLRKTHFSLEGFAIWIHNQGIVLKKVSFCCVLYFWFVKNWELKWSEVTVIWRSAETKAILHGYLLTFLKCSRLVKRENKLTKTAVTAVPWRETLKNILCQWQCFIKIITVFSQGLPRRLCLPTCTKIYCIHLQIIYPLCIFCPSERWYFLWERIKFLILFSHPFSTELPQSMQRWPRGCVGPTAR